MKKPIKYTCADCAHHICSGVCVNGTYACNGDCKVIEQKMKCDAKICSHFLLDSIQKPTKQIIHEQIQNRRNGA